MPRITRRFLESANRTQLKAYLESKGAETYADESTPELRETALAYFEQGEPDESPQYTLRRYA